MRLTKRHRARLLRDKYWEVVQRDGSQCHICGNRVNTANRGRKQAWDSPTLDHVIPISEGGTDALENLAIAHFVCNRWRKTFPIEVSRRAAKRIGLTGIMKAMKVRELPKVEHEELTD